MRRFLSAVAVASPGWGASASDFGTRGSGIGQRCTLVVCSAFGHSKSAKFPKDVAFSEAQNYRETHTAASRAISQFVAQDQPPGRLPGTFQLAVIPDRCIGSGVIDRLPLRIGAADKTHFRLLPFPSGRGSAATAQGEEGREGLCDG